MRQQNTILAWWSADPAAALQKIRGHMVRDVHCAEHGRNAQEARVGALELVPGVRTERGNYVVLVEGRNRY